MDKSKDCLEELGKALEEDVPRHAAVAEELRQVIQSGRLRAGDPFFSESELVRQYGLSRGTIRLAVQTLVREGLLRVARGRRSIVLAGRRKNIQQLRGFSEEMVQRGVRPSSQLITLALRAAPKEVRDVLALDEGEKVFEMKRLRLGDGKPLVFERSFIPHRICPDLSRHDMEKNSLYSILENQYHIRLARSEEEISAIAANPEVAILLEVPQRSPILQMERTVFSDLDEPIEFARSLFRSDRFSITVHSVRTAAGAGNHGGRLP